MPIERINPAPYNPRKDLQPDDPEYQALRRSIEEFGLVETLVWNEQTGHLVGGHQRFKILQAEGAKSVEVSVVNLPIEREKALNVALNKIQGDWDKVKLEELLRELNALPDFDETLTGFSSREIQRMLFPFMQDTPEQRRAAEIRAEEIKVRPGQLWILGRHRLICGDAMDKDTVARLLGGIRPKLMVTDPPYGVGYEPEWRQEAAAAGHLSYADRRVGQVKNDDRVDWSDAWGLFPGDVIYCWHAGRFASTVQKAIEQAGFEIRCQIIWSKSHFPISRGHYHWRHEPCWYAVRKGADAGWIGGRDQTTVREITLDENVGGGHSTQKPLECMAFPIRNHQGDVYDPFVGSGTTIVAAEEMKRSCYAMDIDPHYCAIAIARWELQTSGKAHLAADSVIRRTRRPKRRTRTAV